MDRSQLRAGASDGVKVSAGSDDALTFALNPISDVGCSVTERLTNAVDQLQLLKYSVRSRGGRRE
ncbi:hypothetical protein SAMN04488557_1257 [Hyphomicrobium facile]|uniref:Uncharacterized protein n=1 Tax=Hyphomicrobium facile TaxID=51670 RepID=A0A1I7N486_9HYPH|nr:hypothetical protein SAMN04488557_1257 [Hyphomicrobium facile]